MPEETIQHWLIIDWQNSNTRTRKSKPAASDLGTHELATELTLDVIIPEVDVDELRATVEVPKPRVEQTALADADADDAPDWMDVADEVVDDFLERHGYDWSEWWENEDSYLLEAVEQSPTNPPVDDLRQYCDDKVRDAITDAEEGSADV